MKKTLVFAILAAVLVGGFGYWVYQFVTNELPKKEFRDTLPLPANQRAEVDAYLRENINTLSPEPAVLGGTFYITNITFVSNSQVLINYEDGHNAFAAKATIFLEPGKMVKVLDFAITQKN